MTNLLKILIITLMLSFAVPSNAQFGKLLNKAKEKAKEKIKEEVKEEVNETVDRKATQAANNANANMTNNQSSKAMAEAGEDLPAIYSIAKSNNVYGPDSDLDEVLYPQLAYDLKSFLYDLSKGRMEIASTTWQYKVTRIMEWVTKRDMNEERLKAWTNEFNRVKNIYNKVLRGDAPEPTGDKKADAYAFLFYNLEKAKAASDRDKLKDIFTNAAMSREIYINKDIIAESDPQYNQVFDELVKLRKKLEPYGYKNLIEVKTFSESKKSWKESKESGDANKYNLTFTDNYHGSDKAELIKLAKNAISSKYKGAKILHSNFKHGWVTNEERSGRSVSGHNKKCRVMVYFTHNKKYYSCETYFKMQAPVGSNFTKTDWPGLTQAIEVPEEVFNREFNKFKKKSK